MSVAKKFFTQAFLLYFMYLLLVYLPFLLFASPILMGVGLSQEIANGYVDIAYKILLSDFFDVAQVSSWSIATLRTSRMSFHQ